MAEEKPAVEVEDFDNNPFSDFGPRPGQADAYRAAKAYYIANKGVTLRPLSKKFGVEVQRLERWAYRFKWAEQKNHAYFVSGDRMDDQAREIADRQTEKKSVYGQEITAEQSADVVAELSEEEVAAKRADIIGKHRKEWAAPRALSVEAVRERNFERAKLAKITAETLKLVQDGERRAWGIDRTGEQSLRLIIERE